MPISLTSMTDPPVPCLPGRSQSAAWRLGNKSTVERSREIDALDHQRAGGVGVGDGTESRRGPVRAARSSPVPEMAISDTATDWRDGRG